MSDKSGGEGATVSVLVSSVSGGTNFHPLTRSMNQPEASACLTSILFRSP
jgi:hypothetical protein